MVTKGDEDQVGVAVEGIEYEVARILRKQWDVPITSWYRESGTKDRIFHVHGHELIHLSIQELNDKYGLWGIIYQKAMAAKVAMRLMGWDKLCDEFDGSIPFER